MGKGGQQGKGGQPDLTDLAEAAQVRTYSLCLPPLCRRIDRRDAPHPTVAVGPHHRSLSSVHPRPQLLALPQVQFDFFAQAVPFLKAATSDELLRTVAEYTRFLEGGARSCPSFAVSVGQVVLLSIYIYSLWRMHSLTAVRSI